jgi:hypothetical protein
MRRIHQERPKPRRDRPVEPLPIDPRDPDILRAKSRLYAQRMNRRGPRDA